MNLFNDTIQQLRGFLGEKEEEGALRTLPLPGGAEWPQGRRGNVVLAEDTAVELGNPRDESASFMVWTQKPDEVRDGMLHIVGPDLAGPAGRMLPFGKAVILGVRGMNGDNCYDRHRALELIRYDLNLKGYMMRAASQYLREWSRVSKEALVDGFSLETLSGALAGLYRSKEFVCAVEIVVVTSKPEDVRALKVMGERAERIIGAMNKMTQEMSFDCGSCDFTDVCDEVDALRKMRKGGWDRGARDEH